MLPTQRTHGGRVAITFAWAEVEGLIQSIAHRLRRPQRGAGRERSPNIKNILRWGRVGFSHFLPASSKAAEVLQPETGKPWVKPCPLQTNEKRNSVYQRRGHTCFCSFPTSDKAALTLSSGTGT